MHMRVLARVCMIVPLVPAVIVVLMSSHALIRRHSDRRSAFGAKFTARLSDDLPSAPQAKPAHGRGDLPSCSRGRR